jgi:hypothetical protein
MFDNALDALCATVRLHPLGKPEREGVLDVDPETEICSPKLFESLRDMIIGTLDQSLAERVQEMFVSSRFTENSGRPDLVQIVSDVDVAHLGARWR